jgi:hypothetical protein
MILMTLTDAKSLLVRLTNYQRSLENHLNHLTANFIQLENRWRIFKASSEGDHADQFRSGWEQTQEHFRTYIAQGQKIKALLGERVDSLSAFNRAEAELEAYSLNSSSPSLGLQFASNDINDPLPLLPEDENDSWREEYGSSFNQDRIEKVPSNLKGLYCIHNTDFSKQYIGKSDDCIKGRLKAHLKGSHNKNLKALVESGEEVFFYCWQSPDPKYEEAIEIKRLKEVGLLKGQRREKKHLIEYLD